MYTFSLPYPQMSIISVNKANYWAVNMNCSWLSYQYRLIFFVVFFFHGLLLLPSFGVWAADEILPVKESQTTYGPENLLKTVITPFTTAVSNERPSYYSSDNESDLKPIGISSKSSSLNINSLEERFHGPKLYLPARMALGECAEFVVKGSPGAYAAIAMSESNKGAKPIFGHKLRLGADRKLVTFGIIPETGVLSLFVETPIQGDLVDTSLYFEGVIWSKPDFSDLQMASTVLTSQDSPEENSVLVAGQQEVKKQRAVVFDVSKPMSIRTMGGLSSGQP
jgi:hypothetical protein